MRYRSGKLLKIYTVRVLGVFIVYSITLSVVPVDRSLPALETHAASNLSPALQVSFPDMARAFAGFPVRIAAPAEPQPSPEFAQMLAMIEKKPGMSRAEDRKSVV